MYRWLNLRCELIYRVAHRLAKIAQFLPPHPLLKGFAYIGAIQTKIDKVLIVGHRVLGTCEPGAPYRKKGGDAPGPWRGGWRRNQRRPSLG